MVPSASSVAPERMPIRPLLDQFTFSVVLEFWVIDGAKLVIWSVLCSTMPLPPKGVSEAPAAGAVGAAGLSGVVVSHFS